MPMFSKCFDVYRFNTLVIVENSKTAAKMKSNGGCHCFYYIQPLNIAPHIQYPTIQMTLGNLFIDNLAF